MATEELIELGELDVDVGESPPQEPPKIPESPPKKKKKKRTAWYYALSFFIKLGLTALAVFLILQYVAAFHVCHTNIAYPSIRDGDLCLVYRLADYRQGTMVVYKHDGEARYGRVIAFGGDKVNITNDFISVNGYGISENVVYPTPTEGSAISFPYSVPDNCVFVLNDYRSDISDSRTYGGIPQTDVEGAVVFTMRMRGI
ncbi:MAG: signal peptidase I [Lachnospiraceae bacterium]|nr:signal peptidase I [Lachnospiraceae bacterium]